MSQNPSKQLEAPSVTRSLIPVKIIHRDHIEVLGNGLVLLTAPHAAGGKGDVNTGQIAEEASRRSNSYAVIGKTSRELVDLNRVASSQTDFRKSINKLLEENGVRCILDIHGKKEHGIDIGTCRGITASETLTKLVRDRLSRDFEVKVNDKYMGNKPGSIVATYGRREASGIFRVEAVQLEFGIRERLLERNKIVRAMADLVELVNTKLGFQAQSNEAVEIF
jgi:hypothetical protein